MTISPLTFLLVATAFFLLLGPTGLLGWFGAAALLLAWVFELWAAWDRTPRI